MDECNTYDQNMYVSGIVENNAHIEWRMVCINNTATVISYIQLYRNNHIVILDRWIIINTHSWTVPLD